MKKILYFFIVFIFPFFTQAANIDTTVYGVRIVSGYNKNIFPPDWQNEPVSATGKQISASELNRTKQVVIKALKKYPGSLLSLTLKNVYLLKYMSFFNVEFGGTNSTDAVYLSNDGEQNGYTDAYIEQTFHHEYSSILFRDYPSLIDTLSWKKQNERGFDYNDPENGVGAIRQNESSQGLSTELAKKGMLTQYAMSSLENDINTIAQNLFRPVPEFWRIADSYPRVQNKVKLLIAFYGKLNPGFTEKYFRSFNQY